MKIKSYFKHLGHLDRKSYLTEESALGKMGVLDCSLGINHFGVSEIVVEAAREYDWSRVWDYPDHTYKDLKGEIRSFWAEYADLEIEQVQIGHGASAVLDGLNKMCIGPGSKVLGYTPQWPDYADWVEACGGKYESIITNSEEAFKFHVERLVARITSEYHLIFIDNPNNPTGQAVSLEEIEEILRQAESKDVVVVVDEAYGDYMEKEKSAVGLMGKYRNLVVVRSFSKGLGLAGLRVGYGILPAELNKYYNCVNVPLCISAVSCYLATVALSDQDFIHSCRRMVKREKTKLIKGLREKGYLLSETLDSCPIFLLGHEDRSIDLRKELLDKGILTVGGGNYQNLGSNYVRVNTPHKAEDFLSCL